VAPRRVWKRSVGFGRLIWRSFGADAAQLWRPTKLPHWIFACAAAAVPKGSIMSSISSLGGVTTTPNSSNQLPASSQSQQLTSGDFINFLITELQNQDPLNPTSSDQMLSQLSEIGQLQSSTTMVSTLTSMVQQNQTASASALIGKQVQGTDQNQNPISGAVTAVQVTTSGVNLQLDSGATMPMNNLTTITDPSTSTSGSTSSSSSGS
jgi:flagellar basal-body rod modification protein FlgD